MIGTSAVRKIQIDKFHAKVIATPADGDCMLHSIARALYPSYTEGVYRGRKISQREIVKKMRKNILEKLDRIDPKTGSTGYELVAGGSFAETSEFVETTRMAYLRNILSSSQQIGEEVKVIIEHFIECNILLLDSRVNRLYTRDGFNKDWNCIVLYHTIHTDGEGQESGHFELVVLDQEVFDPSHPFVRFLLKN